LSNPGHFGPLLGFGFFGRKASSFFYHLFALLVPLPLLVHGVKLGGLGGRRSWRLGLDHHLRHITPCMGLQEL